MLSLDQDAFLAVDLHRGAVLLHGSYGDAAEGLAHLDGLRVAAVQGEHRRLVADDADQRDFGGAGGARKAEQKRNKINSHR